MNRNFTVGIFILGALALLATGLFMIGNRHQAFSKHLVVYADFRNLAGLTRGSKVQVGGVDAGSVEEIRIPDSPSSTFRVGVRLDESLHGLVRTDSVAAISTEGVVGDTFLAISPGSASAPAISAGGVLRGKEPLDLSALLDAAKGTMADVDTTVRNANGVLASVGGNLNETLTTARGAITDVDTVVNGIKRGQGTAGLLLRNPQIAASVRQIISNTQAATQNLQAATTQVNALLTDVHARNFPEKLDDTLGSVKDATARIDNASEGIQQIVAELTEPDSSGNTVGVNLRETLANVNSASGNMAEDTEALKHNLLLSGFFRRRGYYSLMGINTGETSRSRTQRTLDHGFKHRNSSHKEQAATLRSPHMAKSSSTRHSLRWAMLWKAPR